ncbi:MAG: phage portal protein [Chloroflexota bacterium]
MPLFSRNDHRTELTELRREIGELREAAERATLVQSPSVNRAQRAGNLSGGQSHDLNVLYQAYLSCPWISAPIDTIAKRITSGGFGLAPTNKSASKSNESRLQDFFSYCNDEDDLIQLLQNAITATLIFGAGMWEVVPVAGVPYQLYLADGVTVLPETDERGTITGYMQRLGDGTVIHLQAEQIVRFALRGPRGEALSPIRKLLNSGTIYNHMVRWNQKFFEHGARPSGVLELGEKTSADAAERQRVWLEENYTGVDNVGSIPVLYGGAQLKPFGGTSAVDLDFQKGLEYLREEFLTVLGVPLSQLGIVKGGGLANEGESLDKAFRNNTINPLRRLIEEKVTYRIIRQGFGIEDWQFELHESNYENDQLLVKLVTDKVAAGLIDRDEGRKQLGENGALPGGGGKVPTIQLSRELVPTPELADTDFHSTQFLSAKAAVQPAPAIPANAPAEADLARWQRVALRDLRAARSPRPFVSEAIPEELMEWLRQDVLGASDEDQIRAIFDRAFAEVRGLATPDEQEQAAVDELTQRFADLFVHGEA